MKNYNLISLPEYAKQQNVSRQCVHNWISGGKLVLGRDYTIISGRKFIIVK